ncbi:MAG: hypothetical protein CMP20_04070 [Rickettsiales bacterium]|nr:hypothetical protein [Rickettsiales bacterium]
MSTVTGQRFIDPDDPRPLRDQIGEHCDFGRWISTDGWEWRFQGHDAFGNTDGEKQISHIAAVYGPDVMLELSRVTRGLEMLVFLQWGWVLHKDAHGVTVSRLARN